MTPDEYLPAYDPYDPYWEAGYVAPSRKQRPDPVSEPVFSGPVIEPIAPADADGNIEFPEFTVNLKPSDSNTNFNMQD